MRKRQVAILYTNPLFAQGIACLLRAEPRLQVHPVDAGRAGAGDVLRQLQPEVVIVDHDGRGPAIGALPMELLAGERSALLIVLGLKGTEMELFYNRRVTVATPDTLLEAVLEGNSGKRRTTSHR